MDKAEAILAVELNAICENNKTKYYAYGNVRIKELKKPPMESIILHHLKMNSITYAEIEKTAVVDWKASAAYVENRLERIRAKQAQNSKKELRNND